MDETTKQAIQLAIADERERTDKKFQRLEDKWHDSEKQQAAMNQKLNDLSDALDKVSDGQGKLWNNITTLSGEIEQLKETSRWVKDHLLDAMNKAESKGFGYVWKTGTGVGVLYAFLDQVMPHLAPILERLAGG